MNLIQQIEAEEIAKAGKDIPDFILADGPVITKETAPGHLWLQKNFLI